MTAVSKREAWLLLTPLLIFLTLMLGFPIAANVVYSLSTVTFETIRSPALSGFGNYLTAASDPAFHGALLFSLRFALLTAAVELAFGLALALALEPLVARRKWLLAILLLPMMISPALMGVMWRLMLNEFVGIVPQYLGMLGWYPNLLGPGWVVTTLVVIEVLQWTPFAFLILLTALQQIPGEILEASRIDGAGAWQRLRHVLLPLLLPALVITAAIRFIDGFRVFDHIYVLTAGGPGTLTTSASIFIYKSFFQQGDLGEAVAAAMLLLVGTLAVIVLATRLALRGAGR
jgi:multiple sugar transport system permease protein